MAKAEIGLDPSSLTAIRHLAVMPDVATIPPMKPQGKDPMDVSVRVLKNCLSEYLRRVQAGEEVHVTLRGKRIARLLPEPTVAEETEGGTIARLDATSWIQPPKRAGKPSGAAKPLPAGMTSEELVKWLRE